MFNRRVGIVGSIPGLFDKAGLKVSNKGYASFRYKGIDVFYSPESEDGVAACFHVFKGKQQVLEAYDTGLSERASDEGVEFDRFSDGKWLNVLRDISVPERLQKSPRSFSGARRESGFRPKYRS
ncbi:MAG: hypothetical protein AABX35_03515 [Nanoarchaeota archaeon]